MVSLAAVTTFLEQFAPSSLAAPWDNVGLLLGDTAAEIRQIMTCLNVTTETAAEAIAAGAELIVCHHPILFHPVGRLTTATPEGRTLLALARKGVAVFSPHTSFDNTEHGINDVLAQRLGLQGVEPLRRQEGPRRCKFVVFVPEADLSRVADALFAAGAGEIGQYRECSFRLAGTGTFFGSDLTNPAVGQKGRREEVSEWRLEALCPEARVPEIVAAVRKAHSYEEPAFDVYPLQAVPSSLGEGRIGRLPSPTTLQELAAAAKGCLSAHTTHFVGAPERPVQQVAVACGAGDEFIADAICARADVLLTGEARFQDFLAAEAQGLALILPGHYATERCGVEELASLLQQRWPDLKVWASRCEGDPLHAV
jgi:dinuclear metal center YbgI/SA1388 family protein